MLWLIGCPCRWCSILSDNVPLEVMLEFRLVSPTWDCTRGNRQGQTLPLSHKNSMQLWPLQRHRVLWPEPAARNHAVDANLPLHLATYGVVSLKWWELPSMLHSLCQLWTLCFCSPLGALNILQWLHSWRIVHAGLEWGNFFAWQTLVVAPRVCTPSRPWLDILLLILITLYSLGKHRLALPIFSDQLLCLTLNILLEFHSVFIFSSALKQNYLLIVFQFAMKHCSKPFPLTGFQRVYLYCGFYCFIIFIDTCLILLMTRTICYVVVTETGSLREVKSAL